MTLFMAGFLFAEKKILDHDIYGFWNQMKEKTISNDGDWVMYSLGPEKGDTEVHITDADGETNYTFPRGKTLNYTSNSAFAVFLISPFQDSLDQAEDKDVPEKKMPKDSLGIVNLQTGEAEKYERVKSYELPEEGGSLLALLHEKPLDEDTTEADTSGKKEQEEEPGEEKEKSKESSGKDDKKKDEGTELVLRQLESEMELNFQHATEYRFSKDGDWLFYAAASKDSMADGIYAVNTSTGARTEIMTGPGDYKAITIDEAGTQIAFLSNRDDFQAEQPEYILYRWEINRDNPQQLASKESESIPEGWWVSEYGDLEFSENGKRLYFGTAPIPKPEPEEIPEHERVDVDIWHWQDPYLQPMQKERLEEREQENFRAVVHLRKGRVVQLANQAIGRVLTADEGNADMALGRSHKPYRKLISWEYPRYYDLYLINVKTGEREKVLEKVQHGGAISPNGEYLYWWDRYDRNWYAMDVGSRNRVNLTEDLPYPVDNQKHDWPYEPNSYGRAGWTENDEQILIYDRFDIWAIDPDGEESPRCITEEAGRNDSLRFRYVRLDREQQFIKPGEEMLLSAFNVVNKQNGFYEDKVTGTTPPRKLIFAKKGFSNPTKADSANQLLFTREDFQEFPDLWVSDLNFQGMKQISDVNPQQDEYLWGTAELYNWRSLDGNKLDGILIKPGGFNPDSTYPMITYFYETTSRLLYHHWIPEPERSIINFSFYASRGYVIFIPDIPYQVGYPGESALDAVLPGVTKLMEEPWIDADRIGVQGHSWGGYQIAYLVTQTDIFRCAEAGAPVSNMVSAYGGIRWGSGMSRMFQYEETQSRIGGSLWEYPLRYIENSPIFWADKINTPLLMLHNDKDGAVPWYQGIELFVALRRLGKPAWMINYNDAPHWPQEYQDVVDWNKRMQTYFDYYLKDAPAPKWIEEGLPRIEHGRSLGFETE